MPTILLVEDNEANRDMLSRRLKKKGFEIEIAVNGKEGVDKATAIVPDLILMDLSLPVMDGWEATRQVKASGITRHVPIIALTAHAMAGDRQKALEAGCDDYDTKPVDIKRLLGKIERLLKDLPEKKTSTPSKGIQPVSTSESDALPYEAIFETAPDAMILVDKQGAIALVNAQTVDLFGYSKEELLGQPIEVLIPARFVGGHHKHRDSYAEAPSSRTMGAINQELWGLKKSGDEFPVEISLSPIRFGNDTWICSAIRDVTEKKLLNQQRLATKEQLKNILQNVPGVIYRCECHGNWPMIMISNAVHQLIGYKQEEFVGEGSMPFVNAIHEQDRVIVEEKVMQSVAEQNRYELDYRVVHKNGTVKWVHEIGQGVYDADGNVLYLDGVISDITKSKRAEEALIRAKNDAEQANRAKSAFLANMSHELRTPLNAIIGYSEMLMEDAEDIGQDDFIPDLDKIKGAGQHLLELINNVLDLSKVEAGKMDVHAEQIEIAHLFQDVKETVSGLVAWNDNAFEVALDDDVPQTISSDFVKLKQLLLNLLSNAAKFTQAGKVELRGEMTGNEVVFAVKDSGIGIAEDKLSTLFEEFTQADDTTTREYGGTGLGLAITKRFTEMLQGRVEVNSVLGEGTEFRVILPLAFSESSSEPAPSNAVTEAKTEEIEQDDSGKPPVLVIEDDPDASDLMERILTKEGHRVVKASNGVEGLEKAKSCKPFVITLDIMMPEKDGWSVLRELKNDQHLKDIPVIMVSVLDNLDIGYALGAEGYMTKPIRKEALVDTIDEFLPDSEKGKSSVLIVDDEIPAQELLAKVLSKRGYSIQVANNGKEALERIAEEKPALVLLDLMMPVMDGFTFMRELRSQDPNHNIPVVVVTARDLSKGEMQELDGNVEHILLKGGYGIDQLLEEVKHWVKNADNDEIG